MAGSLLSPDKERIPIKIMEWHTINSPDSDHNSSVDSEGHGQESAIPLTYKILIFGKDQTGKGVCVIVKNFPTFFYLSLPKKWDSGSGTLTSLGKKLFNRFKKKLTKGESTYSDAYNDSIYNHNTPKPKPRYILAEKHAKAITATNLLWRKKFRGFTNARRYPFIRLCFSNSISMRRCIDLFIERKKCSDGNQLRLPKGNKPSMEDGEVYLPALMAPGETMSLYESNIDPLLRFLHIQELSPSGWISVPRSDVIPDDTSEETTTTSVCEIESHWQDVLPVEEPCNIPMTILSFDIECTSSHGDFPQAKKDYKKLAKDLLTIPNKKLNCAYLLKILMGISTQDIDDIHQVFPKNKKRWSSEKRCRKLSQEIYFILKVHSIVCEFRKENSLTLNYGTLFKKLGRCEPESIRDLEVLNQEVSFIPSLEFVRKQSFCGLDDSSVEEDASSSLIEVKYSEKRDPSTYTESQLTDICGVYLPELEGDKVIQICGCFMRHGESESYRKVILTLGSCDNFDEDTEVQAFEDEDELLLQWQQLIASEDPDVITGYNIFNFDWPYLFERAEELSIFDEFSQISRLRNFKCEVKETNNKGIKGKFVDIPGRIEVDLYKIIQRDHNLQSYKLDNVSATFIRGKVKSLKPDGNSGNTIVETDNTIGLKIGNYVQFILEKGYDEEKVMNGKKFSILRIGKTEILVKGEVPYSGEGKCVWCLGKDDVSAADIFRLQDTDSAGRAIVAKYCVMDTILCLELMNKLQILNNNIGMANVCSTPLSWIFKRGQGIKILSLVSKECRKKMFLIPTLYPDTYGDDSYEGAIVLKPYPGIYLDDAPVSVLDYASLYPNSMRSKNLSHETLVTDKRWLGDEGATRLKELGFDHLDVTYDNYRGAKDKKVKTGKQTVRFVQAKTDSDVGIIPNILTSLLSARKTTRKRIIHRKFHKYSGETVEGLVIGTRDGCVEVKNDSGEIIKVASSDIKCEEPRYSKFEQSVFDGLQLAYKVTANSLYGQMGAKTSPVYWKEIAAATTATGREQLDIAKTFIEQNYDGSKIVYGDTDSVFVKFSMKDKDGNPLRGKPALERSIKLGHEAADGISKILRKPQDLEYEKTFMPFILLSKKRYVGNKYEEDTENYKQTSMGIVLKRRDNATILKVIYGGVIDIILAKNNVNASIDFLRKSLRDLIRGRFGLDKLIITKTLNDHYKVPEMIAHKVLADRIGARDPGNKPQLFDRIPYVYIQKDEPVALQGDRIEHPDYINQMGLKPDYHFYVTNQIMKPISQIYSLVIEQLPTFRKGKEYFNNQAKKYRNQGWAEEKIEKKVLQLKAKEAELLLFQDTLRQCENQKARAQEITKWFGT